MKYLENINYEKVDECLEYLSNYQLDYYLKTDEITIFHVYWYGQLTRKQLCCINSFLVTQDLTKTKLYVWLDKENGYYINNINLITKHQNIEIKCYDYRLDSIGTLFEGKPFLSGQNNLKFRSDIARMLFLYKYGGLYYDLDCILLKDFSNLLDLEFCYQWSTELRNKGNNGILRLKKQSNICKYMMNKYIIELKKRNFFLGFNIHILNDDNNITCLPCSFFDPVWILTDNKTSSKYSKLDRFDDFFKNANEKVNVDTFFKGTIYAYHWHSRNNNIIEKNSYFEQLENSINNNLKKLSI